METRLLNPYHDLAAVRDPAMFFGRGQLLRRLYSAIAYQQCVSLVGARHMGKTSVLYCLRLPQVQQRFAFDLSRHILVFIDLRLQKTRADFFAAVSKQIIVQGRGRLTFTLPTDGDGEDTFSSVLDAAEEQGLHPVLLMDAFDNVARNQEFDLDFFGFLRAQATIGKVSYITASIAPLYEVCHRGIRGSPFFNIFSTFMLEPLSEEEARELVQVPAHRAGLSFTEEETTWILRLAGRHPFFIQRVCYFLFEEKCLNGSAQIDFRNVKSQAYHELLPHFEDAWERTKPEEQEMLKYEAQRKEGRQRALPELSESSLFRKFVRDKCDIHLFHMTQEEVESVLDKLDDAQALGESDLRHLNIVTARTRKNAPLSTIERGMIVRAVLTEAFERMSGNGVRRDSAPDWRLYNILYYRYFKNRLKNEQIAARLEFTSTRQYFRERNKAIGALFHILCEMEAEAHGKEDE